VFTSLYPDREHYGISLCSNVIISAFCPQSSSQTDVCLKTLPTPQQPKNHFLKAGKVFKWIFRNIISALFGLSGAAFCVEHYVLVLFARARYISAVRFQVLTAASMMFRVVFWDILPCIK
jgi:hypothetical protein